MFCPTCGALLLEGAQFCSSCGVVAGAVATPPRPYAGFWIRFAAYLIDACILGVPSAIIAIPFFAVMIPLMREPEQQPVRALVIFGFVYAAIFVLTWLYFTLFESSSKQATPGKLVLGLVVSDLQGRRISFGRANGRYWCKILSGAILYIGFIMAAFTEKKQALHDLIAGCLVLKKG